MSQNDEYKKQVQMRAGHRAVATKTAKKISDLVSGYSVDKESNLRALDSVLREKIDLLKKLDDTILSATEPDSMEKEIDHAAEVLETLHIALFEVEKCLPTKNGMNSSSASSTSFLGTRKGVRLPKLELKNSRVTPKTGNAGGMRTIPQFMKMRTSQKLTK